MDVGGNFQAFVATAGAFRQCDLLGDQGGVGQQRVRNTVPMAVRLTQLQQILIDDHARGDGPADTAKFQCLFIDGQRSGITIGHF